MSWLYKLDFFLMIISDLNLEIQSYSVTSLKMQIKCSDILKLKLSHDLKT